MKNLFVFCCLLGLYHLTGYAQIPNQFAFQGVARNGSSQPVANQTVGVRFTVRQGSAGGAIVYSETHSTQTTGNGTFNVSVGGGNATSGSFSAINWSAGPYFLQVELDPAGGSNYITVSTTQLQSVPYAITAKNLEGVDNPQEGDMIVFRNNQWQKKPAKKFYHTRGGGAVPTTSLAMLSVPVTVVISEANPTLYLNFSKAFGSIASGGGTGLTLNIGYRRIDIPNQPITEFDANHAIGGYRVAVGSRVAFPVSAIYQTTLAPGTYELGMVGFAASAAQASAWNDNGSSLGTVEVDY